MPVTVHRSIEPPNILSTTGTFARVTVIGAVLLAAVTVISGAGPLSGPERGFEERVAAYMALHHEIEAPLTPLRVTADPLEIEHAVLEMASAMRRARSQARMGDIFTDEIARVFRARIDDALSQEGLDTAGLVADIVEDNSSDDDSPAPSRPAVNERFLLGFAMTPPLILQALPRLPNELQYRFVGTELVLVDLHSGLVVDVLPQALPLP